MIDNEKAVDKTVLNDEALSGVAGGFERSYNGDAINKEDVHFLFNVGEYVEVGGDFFGTNRALIIERKIDRPNGYTSGAYYPLYHVRFDDTMWKNGDTWIYQGEIQRP